MKPTISFSSLKEGDRFRFLGTHKYYTVFSISKRGVHFTPERGDKAYLSFKKAAETKIVLE